MVRALVALDGPCGKDPEDNALSLLLVAECPLAKSALIAGDGFSDVADIWACSPRSVDCGVLGSSFLAPLFAG